MSSDDARGVAEVLLLCECGHGLDEHNGLGCYVRLSYTPLVTCECKLTDDRTHADLLAPNLARLIEQREAAARAEGRREVREAVERLANAWAAVPPYTPSDYDQGRVDQREMCGIELAAVLAGQGGESGEGA